MMEDYLYNPNSPYYNEGLYVLFLKRMLESKYVDDLKKEFVTIYSTVDKSEFSWSEGYEFYILSSGWQ